MTVYVAGRQAGKTVFLIQQSAKTGANFSDGAIY